MADNSYYGPGTDLSDFSKIFDQIGQAPTRRVVPSVPVGPDGIPVSAKKTTRHPFATKSSGATYTPPTASNGYNTGTIYYPPGVDYGYDAVTGEYGPKQPGNAYTQVPVNPAAWAAYTQATTKPNTWAGRGVTLPGSLASMLGGGGRAPMPAPAYQRPGSSSLPTHMELAAILGAAPPMLAPGAGDPWADMQTPGAGSRTQPQRGPVAIPQPMRESTDGYIYQNGKAVGKADWAKDLTPSQQYDTANRRAKEKAIAKSSNPSKNAARASLAAQWNFD